MKYALRKATDDDYWYCYKLTKKNMLVLFTEHWGGWVPAEFRKGYKNNQIRIVIQNGKRIGYISTINESDRLYIDNIQISRMARNKGIGSHILKLIIRNTKHEKLSLTTFPNNPAMRLYQRLGFTTDSVSKGTVKMSLIK